MNEKEENGKLDWMYKGANSLVDREDYLLGKSVDKPLEQLNSEEKEKRLGTVLPKNHVEHECIPPSIREFNKIIQAEQVDLPAKLQEDPLVNIRKKQEEARRQFLQNPVQLKKLQDALNSQKLKKEKKKRKKNKKSEYDLDELKKLKNGQFPMMLSGEQDKESKDLDTILMHKFNMFKNILPQEDYRDIIAGKLSDSEEEKIERESSDTSRSDEKYGKNKKQYKKAEDHRGASGSKYTPKQTHKSRTNNEDRSKGKDIDKSGSKYNHKRTNSRDGSSGEESDQDSGKKRKANGKVQKKRNRSSSEEKSNRRDKSDSKYTRRRTPSSSEDSEHERKKSNSTKESQKKSNSDEKRRRKDINKDDSKYSRERLPSSSSSSSEDSEHERKKRKSIRESQSNHISGHSKDRIKSKDSHRGDSKYSKKIKGSSSSEESDNDTKMRKATKEPPSRRKDAGKGSKYNDKEKAISSSEDSEHDRKKSRSIAESRSKKNHKSRSRETTSRKDINKKHNNSRDEPHETKNTNTVAGSGKDLDRLISERLRMLRDSDPVKSGNHDEKNRNGKESVEKDHSHYDSDNDKYVPKQKAFGLVRADGTKIPFKGTYHEEKAYEPANKQDALKKPDVKKIKRLTDEEKEKIRKQMMADAAEREVERSESLKRYRQENEREEQNSGNFDKSFVHKELLKSTKNATVEGRVKAKLNNIQRSSQHMNSNFSKR